MKVAVPFENGRVFAHFGKTASFLIAEIDGDTVCSETLQPTNGSGHGALSVLLAQWGVDTVICGGIGGGAVQALQEKGIAVIRGVDMDARMALQAFANGALQDRPDAQCEHHAHGEGHSCGQHTCKDK